MPAEITIHGFETSNNMKVRVALGYKEIPYDFETVDPADRTGIVRISGQHLTPVMVHGDRVLFDSAAILRYLDANFRNTPRLFGTGRSEQWAIEDEELFARHTLMAPMMQLVHTRVSGGEVDDAMVQRCNDDFARAAGRLMETLSRRTWLVGDALSAADITAAAVMYRVRSTGVLHLPPGIETLDDWQGRVMRFDRHLDGMR